MKVREIMTSEGLATASLDTTLEEIANMMRDENVGAIPILDDDENLAGIITDRDIVVRAVAEGQDTAECTAEDILSEELHTIEPESDIEDAADLMARHKIRRLPVVEEGTIVGMISLGDISVKVDEQEDHAADALEGISEGVKESASGSRSQERNRGQESRSQSGPRLEGRNQRQESGSDRNRQNRGAAQRSGGQSSATGRRSSGEQVAADEAEYQRSDARRNSPQQGGSRSENANAGRIRNQSKSQQSIANEVVNVEGEEEFELENAGGGNARQRANQQQSSVRGRQNTSARGRNAGQVRGEDARSQGVSNRSGGEERSRQQKVAPMRAEANNPGRSRAKRRAS